MSTTTTTTTTTTITKKTPKLLLKSTLNSPAPVIATAPVYLSPSTTTASGSFYLPIKQKHNRRGGRYHQKHLRKPPSFDTYLPTSSTYPRTPSMSSSYSSTDSFSDGLTPLSTPLVPRRRRASSVFKVRFADANDDVSSISSSSSSVYSVEEWETNDLEVDEEEEYIFVSPSRQPLQHRHYYDYHKKSEST